MSKTKKKREVRPRGIRPFWSGTLTFGLVSVPVEIYPGQTHSRVAMRMLAPDGTPLQRRYYCPEHQVDVHQEHLVRGFQLNNGDYVIIRDEELQAASPQKSREIDLRQFVDIDQVPQRLFERSYFLTPAGDSNKAYRLLAETMEQTALAGIATFVMRGKEYLVAILAEAGILRAQTLRFSDEVRSADEVGLPPVTTGDPEAVRRFGQSIRELSQPTLQNLDLRDHHLASLLKLVRQKQDAGEGILRIGEHDAEQQETADPTDSSADGQDLLEVIRQSLSRGESRSRNGRTAEPDGSDYGGGVANSKLNDLTKQQLYQRAKQLNIEGRSEMTKDKLIDAIKRIEK